MLDDNLLIPSPLCALDKLENEVFPDLDEKKRVELQMRIQLAWHTLRNNFEKDDAIKTLERHPLIKELFGRSAQVAEGYTVKEHSLMVVEQFFKYLANTEIPHFSREEFALSLLLHDIGKGLQTESIGQSKLNPLVIAHVRNGLPFSDNQIEILSTILSDDTLGRFLRKSVKDIPKKEESEAIWKSYNQGYVPEEKLNLFLGRPQSVDKELLEENVNETCEIILKKASECNLDPNAYLRLLTLLLQSDVSSYSSDAIHPSTYSAGFFSLEFVLERRRPLSGVGELFCHTENGDRLLFSPGYEAAYEALSDALKSS